ncbi:MAG: hypothetical protein IPK02_10330 [Candidatus Accumulibacter sp.]|uniref:Uncharacterized protein n=1 Tax=Candidatus Accumulibacter affinis TaxID=2954384 RepID=A0A935W4P1_9PROT|nr:hypothetical protein [Candidatus Accumulibacter affinis]
MSADSGWKYVNVRRLFLFLEETIDEGAVGGIPAEHPDAVGSGQTQYHGIPDRYVARRGDIRHQSGGAFFVKVDAETQSTEVVDAGRLIIEVGVAPVKPAEFVIIRISQKTLGQSRLT